MSERYPQVGECSVCGIPLVSKTAWSVGHRPDGFAAHGGHGMCRRHHAQAARKGISGVPKITRKPRRRPPRPDGRAPMRPRGEVLEEYMVIRDEVSSVEQAAERIGMSVSALEKALERARQDGHTEARTPNMLRGSYHNQYHNPNRRAS